MSILNGNCPKGYTVEYVKRSKEQQQQTYYMYGILSGNCPKEYTAEYVCYMQGGASMMPVE